MIRSTLRQHPTKMENIKKKCDNCKYAYNSIHSTLVHCKMKEHMIYKSKTGQISIDFKHYSCYRWRERPQNYPIIDWERKEQQLTLF